MADRRGSVGVVLAALLALGAAAYFLTDLVILPFVVALHYLETFLLWVNFVWRL